MNTIHKRMILFLIGCIGTRSGLTYFVKNNYEKYRDESWARMNRFSEKLDRIEKKVDENAHTVGLINKLFWVAIVAASGAVAAQIWM